jgi:hypothetical protein
MEPKLSICFHPIKSIYIYIYSTLLTFEVTFEGYENGSIDNVLNKLDKA